MNSGIEKWAQLADKKVIEKTISALKANGINAIFVNTGEEAKKKVFEMIPAGAEIMTMTSVTLQTLNIDKEIDESGRYNSTRAKLMKMDMKTQGNEMQKIGAASDWAIGSAHAVTQDGHVFFASMTGSQLPAHAYGSQHVVLVAGAHKIVKNDEEAMKRLYERCLPLESERAKKAYGVPGSSVNKILTVNKEINAGRITVIFVNEVLGF